MSETSPLKKIGFVYLVREMSDSLLDSRGCSWTVSFVSEQSGSPFPARGLIILVTKHAELSAILNCATSDLDGYEPPF